LLLLASCWAGLTRAGGCRWAGGTRSTGPCSRQTRHSWCAHTAATHAATGAHFAAISGTSAATSRPTSCSQASCGRSRRPPWTLTPAMLPCTWCGLAELPHAYSVEHHQPGSLSQSCRVAALALCTCTCTFQSKSMRFFFWVACLAAAHFSLCCTCPRSLCMRSARYQPGILLTGRHACTWLADTACKHSVTWG